MNTNNPAIPDPGIPETIKLPDGHLVVIPAGLPGENKAEIRRLTAAEIGRLEREARS
jgi:hypothetical protein